MAQTADVRKIRATVERYVRDVDGGTIIAGDLVVRAVRRHLHDLEQLDLPESKRDPLRWRFDEESATRVIRFFGLLRHWRGEWAGKPFELSPWQMFLLWVLFGWKRKDGTRRFRTGYIKVGRKNGKALDVDTPVPTAEGWKRMGDVEVGDVLFDHEGKPTSVIGAFDPLFGRTCYRVTFDDGTSIIADAEHLWETDAKRDRERLKGKWGQHRRPRPTIKTTERIRETLTIDSPRRLRLKLVEYNHRIPVAGAINCDATDLPIPPYVLGVWLGDGNSGDSRITCAIADAELLDHVRAAGVSVGEGWRDERSSACRHILGSNGRRAPHGSSLRAKLRSQGLLNNKHVPCIYLRASVEQRTMLMRGLMDTDGYVSKAGQCEFTTTSPRLRDGFLELARSLGYKPTLKTARATIRGKDCGDKYRIQFWAFSDNSCFYLKRKSQRLKSPPEKRTRSGNRQIVAVDPVESRPVRCIAVDNPRRLFLAGEGMVATHNTPLVAGIGLYGEMADDEPGAEIYSAATKKDQARIILKDAAMMSRSSPALKKRLIVSPAMTGRNASGNYVANIAYPAGASKFEVLSKESETQDGLSPSMGLVDELHAHKDRGIWDVLDSGTSSRRQPLMIAITTAGIEGEESIDDEMHDIAEKVLEGFDKADGVKDETFFAFIAMASKDDDPYAEPTWHKANPNLGISVKLDDLQRKALRAQQFAGFRAEFFRKHLNLRTQAASAWLSIERWDACRATKKFTLADVAGWDCAAGMDLAAKNDLTALVLLFERDGRYRLLSWYWMPEETAKDRRRRSPFWGPWIDDGYVAITPGAINDFDFLEERIVELGADAKFLNIVFDPHNCVQTANHLRDNHGFAVTEFTQTYPNYNEPCKEFERLIVGGLVEHDGNPVTRFMVGNMALETNAIGLVKPVKPKPNSEKKIDGGAAAIMALSHWVRGDANEGDMTDIPFVVAGGR